MTNDDTLPDRNPNYSEPVQLTEPWVGAFKKAGMVAPITGEPSIQALSRESGVHPSAISRIITGRTRKPRSQTVLKMAKALNVDFVEISRWIGEGWKEFEPWAPPVEANLLNPRQREMMEQLIRELARANRVDVKDK